MQNPRTRIEPTHRCRKRRAFTLLETAIAMFLIVLVGIPCYELLMFSRRLTQQAQIQSGAYQAARQELETLRSLKYSDRTPASGVSFTIPANIATEFSNYSFSGTYTIASYGTYTRVPMQQLTVRVSWANVGKNGTASSSTANQFVQLDTLVAQELGK